MSRPMRPGFLSQELPALLYVVLVFVGGSLPMRTVAGGFAWGDKLVHALAFLVMHLLLVRVVRFELPRLGPGLQQVLAALGAVLLGGLMELYQAALPHRSAELYDWLADVVGVLAALFGSSLMPVRRGLLEAEPRASADSPST